MHGAGHATNTAPTGQRSGFTYYKPNGHPLSANWALQLYRVCPGNHHQYPTSLPENCFLTNMSSTMEELNNRMLIVI